MGGSCVKTVRDAFIEPAYRRVHSEEGDYDAFSGWNVYVYVDGENGLRDVYGYGGPNNNGAMWAFPEESVARDFVDNLHCISHVDCWVFIDSIVPNAVPDYV